MRADPDQRRRREPIMIAARPALAEPRRMSTSREGFRGIGHHARRRRQGALANPVAADALDPVAIDRAGAGADRGAGDRAAAAAELVRGFRRNLGRSDARPGFHTPLNILAWILSIAAGLGVVFGAVFLMPAITSLVASVFVDDVADHVEREHYPAERPGTALPLGLAMTEGVKTALLTILVYLIALPFVFFAGVGFIVFFIATAWLLGREYFELAAMRFRPPAEAKAMRKAQRRARCSPPAAHRGVRLDPDRQSGDAAVRHGLHGPHAQAAIGPAAGTDRAGAQDRACRWREAARVTRPLHRKRERQVRKAFTPSFPASGRDR